MLLFSFPITKSVFSPISLSKLWMDKRAFQGIDFVKETQIYDLSLPVDVAA